MYLFDYARVDHKLLYLRGNKVKHSQTIKVRWSIDGKLHLKT